MSQQQSFPSSVANHLPPLTSYTRPVPGAPSKKRSFAVSQAIYPAITVAPSLETQPEEADPTINFLSSFHEVATPNVQHEPWEIAGLVIEQIPMTEGDGHAMAIASLEN
jgi:hypothetical protein